MHQIAIPSREHSPLERSFAASVGAILELPDDDLPVFAAEPDALADWQSWLGGRALGLVPIADPERFEWPGPWIAVLAGGVAVVAFGVPPGVLWHPLGGDDTMESIERAYMIAPHDVALWAHGPRDTDRVEGRVELLALAPAAEAPMQSLERADVVAGRGVRGDRYFDRQGTFSGRAGNGRELTLVEAENLDQLGLISYLDARRNVVTRGIDLNALVGKRFAIGDVECVGQRLCEPCAHMERLTTPGVLRGLVHKGGLRADVLRGGEIAVGVHVRPL